jgi:hypothetical protein
VLSELDSLDESDEAVWGEPDLSVTIRSRLDQDDEIIEREYTFTHASEWEKWMLSEFEERRTNETTGSMARNFERSRHLTWDDAEASTVDVPDAVTEQLSELLETDEIQLL